MDGAVAGAVSHLRHAAEDQVTTPSRCRARVPGIGVEDRMSNDRNLTPQQRRNIRITAAILFLVVLGFFVSSLLRKVGG